MKLAGDYTFDAPGEEVWKALLDPVVLAATMPGCEKLELIDGQYVGELNIKVGPVQGRFTSKIDLVDVVEPKSYTIKFTFIDTTKSPNGNFGHTWGTDLDDASKTALLEYLKTL